VEIKELLLMIPGPTNVPPRIMKAMFKPMINHRDEEFRALYRDILENLKYAFQTKNDVFPLTCSGTGGVEFAVGNLIGKGDKVIVPVNGLFSERLKEEIIRFGGVPIEVRSEWGSVCSVEEIKTVLETEKDVKAIALVYNETSTGATLRDLPEIGKLTKKHGILLIVDAISVLLGDKLPVDEWNVDVCIAGSQKCFACPPGLAMVSISEKAYEAAEKNRFRPFYHDLLMWREFKGRLETPFTPVLPLYYALDEALRVLKEEGLENRIQRHRVCAQAFYTAFEAMGLDTVAHGNVRSNTVIVPWLPPSINDKEFRRILKEEYGVVVAGGSGKLKGKTFRIGSMGIVSKPEVLRTVKSILESLVKLGYSLNIKTEEIESKIEKIFSGFKFYSFYY
jgi:aspartate aminotransferase-like enzyme